VQVSAPVQTGSGVHPASYIMGTGSFPGVMQPRCGISHPPTSSTKIQERVELYLYSPSVASSCYRMNQNLTIRDKLDLHVQLCNTDLFKENVMKMGIKLYNKVPNHTKELENNKIFKRKLYPF
jgi:hypothetical protein